MPAASRKLPGTFFGGGEGFLETDAQITGAMSLSSAFVPDPHLATILFQNGIRVLYSNKADFRKFHFLEVWNSFLLQEN